MLDYVWESEEKKKKTLDIKLIIWGPRKIIWGPHLGSRPQLWEPLYLSLPVWTYMLRITNIVLHSLCYGMYKVQYTVWGIECSLKSNGWNVTWSQSYNIVIYYCVVFMALDQHLVLCTLLSFSDHYMQVLNCKQRCSVELASTAGQSKPFEDFLPSQLNYLQFSYYNSKFRGHIVCVFLYYLL